MTLAVPGCTEGTGEKRAGAVPALVFTRRASAFPLADGAEVFTSLMNGRLSQ
jgi:hypothetical protein